MLFSSESIVVPHVLALSGDLLVGNSITLAKTSKTRGLQTKRRATIYAYTRSLRAQNFWAFQGAFRVLLDDAEGEGRETGCGSGGKRRE